LLTYEFFLLKDDHHRFVCQISAGGRKEAFPTVTEVVNQASTSALFYFKAFKAAHETPKELLDMSLGHGNSSLPIKDIYYRYIKDENELLSLYIYIKKYDGDAEETLRKIYFILDKVIGEYDTATRIGGITLYKLQEKKGLRPLVDLASEIKTDMVSEPILL